MHPDVLAQVAVSLNDNTIASEQKRKVDGQALFDNESNFKCLNPMV